MKGIATWIWTGGLIVAALLVFSIGYNLIVQSNLTIQQQRSLENFDETRNILDNLCWSFVGNIREYELKLTDDVEGIYVTFDKNVNYSVNELQNNILLKENGYGNYLCIKIKNKRTQCQEMECNISLPYIGAVPEEFSLSSLVNRIMGRGNVFNYYLLLEKKTSDVLVNFKS